MSPFLIRRAGRADVSALAQLCREHASYEHAAIGDGPSEAALGDALFAVPARLHAWMAVDERDRPIGFASATLDYSTWHARAFMHMDCLYVCEVARGAGVGRALIAALQAHARELGIRQIQWQTPLWNVDAQRFYDRLGATRQEKVRFTLELP